MGTWEGKKGGEDDDAFLRQRQNEERLASQRRISRIQPTPVTRSAPRQHLLHLSGHHETPNSERGKEKDEEVELSFFAQESSQLCPFSCRFLLHR